VYRAVTLDSQDVAVKVQYPGVAEALDSDLNNAEMIVKALTAVMPNSDLSHFITDMEDRLHEEVDYRREAENTSRFRSNWAGDERVVLPAVLPELSGERVLTTTWLHGDRWDEMMVLADGPLRAQYGVLIYRFVLQSLYRHGMFNGDPHPGNYLFFPDGRVGFLDFGHVQIYDQAGRQAFCDVRDAVLDGKRGSALRPWIDEAFGMPDNLDDELWELAERYLLLTLEPLVAPQPYRFTPEYPKRLAKLTIDAKMVWMRKALFRGVKDASRPGVVVASRLNFGLPSILAKLGAEADWRAML
jgi:hypothetical protein